MGSWIKGSIKITAFTDDARERVKEINFAEDFGLHGRIEFQGDKLYYYDTFKNHFDAEGIIASIVEALDNEGIAVVTYDCDEDVPEAITHYYLGDGIKAVYFSSQSGDEDILLHEAQYAALFTFDTTELREIYAEITEEDEIPDYIENDYDLINDLMDWLDDSEIYYEGSDFYSTPLLKKLMSAIVERSNNARYDSNDFAPNPGWESKGIVKFSAIELKNLSKA